MCTNIIKAVKSRSDVINNQIHVINNSIIVTTIITKNVLSRHWGKNKGWKQWEHMVCMEDGELAPEL